MKYKDTDIQWLGRIPEHWKLDRIKDKTINVVGGDWGNDPESESKGENIVVLRVSDLDDIYFSYDYLTIRKIKDSSIKNRKINENCLIIEKSGGGEKQLVGRVGYPKGLKVDAISSNFMAKIEFDNSVDLRFVNYMFSGLYEAKLNFPFVQQTTGIQNLNVGYYLTTKVAFPPKKEQIAIADYLDKACERIDKIIKIKEEQLKTLSNYFISYRHKVITQGIDKKVFVSYDDDFLKKVPSDWKLTKLRYLLSLKNGKLIKNSELIKNSKILVPPKKEQIAIADYLDKACKRIDEIIEIKEDQIRKIKKFVNSKYFELLTGKGLKSINTNYPWFKTIPLGWQVKRLKSVVSKVNSGVTPKGGATAYINEGIPLIRSQNVKSNSLDFSDVVFIPEETHNKMKNSKVMNGDVLLNITGASLGRCAFASNIEEANVNQHVCIIRPNLDFIQTKYLYYLLKSEIGQSQIFSGFKGSGREGLNFEAIKSFKLPIPPKQEQNSIIDKLDKLTELSINQNQIIQKQIKTLKNYRKSLIHECVTGKKQVVTQTPIS